MLLQGLTVTFALAAGSEGAAPPVLALVTAPWATHGERGRLTTGRLRLLGEDPHAGGHVVGRLCAQQLRWCR